MNEDNKGYGYFVMLVSGLAMLFSVVALLKHDDWNCEISPAGFVIATLSALITFVVAWQIWQTISSREQLNNLDAKIDAKTKHAIHINLYHVFLFQGINARDCGDNISSINYYFHSLDCANKCGLDYSKIDEIIQKIKEVVDDNSLIDSLQINPKDCHEYESIIRKSKHDETESILSKLKQYKNESAPSQVGSWTSLAQNQTNDNLNWK